MSSADFLDCLPPLRLISRCPLLVEHNDTLVELTGHDPKTGIYAEGDSPATVTLDEAKILFNELLDGFRFATLGDKSRALAAIITPALILGDLLPGRAPIDLGEADQSQTGKGFRNKLTAAVYSSFPDAISQTRGGIGSIEERFSSTLIEGQVFISFDNIRGKVDSQILESFMTEDSFTARCAYKPNTKIDPRHTCIMLTSNKTEMTTDIANRCSCVRILKQADGFQYRSYPEGEILDHVRAKQSRYLGTVFAIVREWHRLGKPRTDETRHDFRAWAQTLDWIVQNLFGAARSWMVTAKPNSG